MAEIRINKTAVDGLEAGEKDAFWWDESLKGFGVKVTPKGRKTYLVRYRLPGRRKSEQYTIGRHGAPWTADTARKEASQKLLLASQNFDPNAEKRRRRNETADYSFNAYVDRFADRYLKENWQGSYKRAQSVIDRHAKPYFGKRDIREITKADCTAFIDKLWDQQATARKAAEVVGKMFRWAEDRGDIERSPMDRVPRPKPSAGRERVLDDAELAQVWEAANEMQTHPYSGLVKMLILTGQRRGEIGGLRWKEVDLERAVIEVPKERTKSGRNNLIPLSASMVELLGETPRLGDYVFSVSGENPLGNHSKLKKKLDAKITELSGSQLPDWTLHNLRRTVATGLQRLGIGSDMIEVVQGRTKMLGAGQRYQRYDYLEEKRAALLAWNEHVASLGQV
ncbi:tyrosine-type recombinase/integrase [Aurantiacibacter hainanensis]|uniref:tyrosine-type recombinase/integrase n=1 Tax=Aurantiacibacter hainanensis TaxID=3076114 RepID=UPI0030C720F3